jgi:DNA repair exonuclease SbcCD nuclease subunit
MFKYIHAADIHLDSPLRGLEQYEGAPVAEARGATRRAFENLVHLALDEHAAFVIIAGDLYDGDWKDYNSGLFFVHQMSKLRDAGIPVFIVSGNHDAASQITRSLRMPPNVTMLSTREPQTITIEDLRDAIHGQGFHSREVTVDLAASYPSPLKGLFNIGVLHTSVTGREGHETYAPCSLETLLSKRYDYWALGHVHAREELHREPWVLFPGNTQGRNARETGPKGCTLVTVEGAECTSVEHRDLHVMKWVHCRVDAAGAVSADEIVERVCADVREEAKKSGDSLLAARITLSGPSRAHGNLSGDPRRWVSEVRGAVTDATDGAAWVEKVVVATRAQVDLEAALKRNDALGDLLRFVGDLPCDDDLLAALREDFAQLKRKAPPEALEGEETVKLDNAEALAQALEVVRQMLVARLLGAGGGR